MKFTAKSASCTELPPDNDSWGVLALAKGNELSLRRRLGRRKPLPLQNQIQITEFVPEIAARDRFSVGHVNLFRR